MALVPSDVVLAQQNVEYAADIKRRVAKGANKSQKILEKHLQTINHAISNSKQNVVKALLQARSLEKAKTQTLDIHNNLHRQLLEKLHPNIFQIREDVEDAVTFNFKKPLPGELLSTLDAAMHWNYPKLIQELVAALTQYSDADFRNYLSTIPDRFLPMSELLFQQIAELGSKGAVSPHEAFVLFAQTKAAQISDSRLEWKQLQNRLCRKILQLFLVKCAAPIVLDVEEKLRAHRGFQFVVSKGSPSSPRPLSTETNSLLLVSASPSPSPSPFATSSLLPETPLHHHQQQQQQQRKNDKTSTTTRKQQRHSESAKANQSKSKRESTAQLLSRTTSGGGLLSTLTSSSAPLVDGNMSASQLAEELQRSQAKQEALKQRMLENMASFVLQHPSEYVHARVHHQQQQLQQATHGSYSSSKGNSSGKPTTSRGMMGLSRTTPSLLSSSASTSALAMTTDTTTHLLGSPRLPPLEHRLPPPSSASASSPRTSHLLSTSWTASSTTTLPVASQAVTISSTFSASGGLPPPSQPQPQTHMAIEQYIRRSSAQKLVDVLYKQVLKLLARKLAHWQQIHQRVLIEYHCDRVTQLLATVRFFRWMEWRRIRRRHEAWQAWRHFVATFEAQEKLSAVLDIQRCFRGLQGRKRAQNEATLRAAQSIQQTFRVFIAKKAAVIMRNNVRRRRAVRRLESMWIRYKHILARKKQRQHQLQERSVRLIQRVYRGHRYGRKQRHQLLLRRRQYQGALRMQGLVRMYHAKERVDRLRRDRLCGLRIVVLQGLVRMAIARRRYQVLLRRHHAVLVITYAWWCSQARYRVWCTRQYQAARRIQCLVRCRIARKRYGVLAQQRAVWRAKRAAAIAVMRPLWLGYLTRRRLRPTLQPYLARRQQAAIPMQCLVRCFLARRRVRRQRQVRAYQRYRIACATKIQALVRAKIIAFHRVQRQRDYLATAYAESRKRFLQLPYYYRLKSTYLTSQDVYHRRYVLKIQCCARRYLARKRIVRQKRKRSALIIQSFVSNRLAIAEARAIVAERRKSIAVQRLHVICLQRMTRGLLQRRALKRAWASQVLRWATREVVVQKKIAQAMATYRARKAYELMYGRTVVRVQAWVRARLGQRRYKQQYRTLVRQRAMRIRARREKAALRIQCAYRIHRARQRVARQRTLFAERARELAELRALEESLEGLHGEWMQELLVIRAQTGFRGHKARETFRQKVEEYKRFHAQEQANVQQKAAAKIQALIRGVLARKQFKKNLPALKRARRALAMCIECETKPATRRCRACRDKYCADCFELIHAKGHRKEHSWENVTVDTRILAMTFDAKSGGIGGGGGGGGGGKKGKKGGAMPAWEEDASSIGGGGGGGGGGKAATKRRDTNVGAASSSGMMAGTGGGGGGGGSGGNGKKPTSAAAPGEWEEFYDASARAKYWYNKRTGEASWINPYQ